MFVSEIFDDREELKSFMDDVQALMRRGQPDVAAGIVEAQLIELADAGNELARRCLAIPVSDLVLTGWEKMGETLALRESKHRPVTAVSIDISAPVRNFAAQGMVEPDTAAEPALETIYYSDNAFPFTAATRESMLEAYQRPKQWHGTFEDIGGELSVQGFGPIYGPAIALARSCEEGENDRPEDHDAAALAQAFVAVRVHQVVSAVLEEQGLPRSMAILVGSNEAYPYFDAPVMLREEYEDLMDASYEEAGGQQDDEMFAEMKLAPPPEDYDPFASAPAFDHISGTALRKRLRESAAFDEPEEPAGAPSVFAKMLSRLVKNPA